MGISLLTGTLEYQVSATVVLLCESCYVMQTAKVRVTVAGFVVSMDQSRLRTSTYEHGMEKVMSTAGYASCLLRNPAKRG